MRPFTVPIGMPSISAIWLWLKPPKYASSTVRRCSAGSVSSALRTLRASSRRAASTSVRSGASRRSATPSIDSRRRSCTVCRRSASMPRLCTIPSTQVRTLPRAWS